MSTYNICFLWRNRQNYPLIIIKYPPYLFHWKPSPNNTGATYLVMSYPSRTSKASLTIHSCSHLLSYNSSYCQSFVIYIHIIFIKYCCQPGWRVSLFRVWMRTVLKNDLNLKLKNFDIKELSQDSVAGLNWALPIKLKCFSEQKIKEEKSLDREI